MGVFGCNGLVPAVGLMVGFRVMVPGGSVNVLRLGGADQAKSKQYRYETHSFPPPQSAQCAHIPQGPTNRRPDRGLTLSNDGN